ncbi:hypothetical protein MF271_23190 (plasmid) [Deinococcus sp. KNUC1210]|uniref:hypothetical protein n=1 Tax=Deinococcus sp. KNUC1210 TaxID=2917691 RepID=UPI001EF02D0D|nr:hypothetical protein [Deinococcus sp. KNUC1210]ULH17883.1 hypothetical protein MF271_23190 [Deinococcus sp. KNUC1210]
MTHKFVALAASLLAFLEFGGLALWIINTWLPTPQLDATKALLDMPGVRVFVCWHHRSTSTDGRAAHPLNQLGSLPGLQ